MEEILRTFKTYNFNFLFFSIIVLFDVTCKQVYFPDLGEPQKILVVEGLLTDESNVITVKLSHTVPFKEQSYSNEIGALVSVNDLKGNKFVFVENPPGTYKSQSFYYEYGSTYMLNVTTQDDRKYQSTPQTLFPKSDMESVQLTVISNTLETTLDGEIIYTTLPGVEISALVDAKSSNSPYFRFENTVMVEYTERTVPSDNPQNSYCWKKYLPNEFFNLSDAGIGKIDEFQQILAFCPIDAEYYGVVNKEVGQMVIEYRIFRDIYYFGFTVKKYNINRDVHQYYKSINDQLGAKNRIFDPISFQVFGNMICTNDPEQPVLGVFEVASVSIRTYSFSNFLPDNSVVFNEIEPLEMDSIPWRGCLYNQYPDFWIYKN